MPGVDKHYSHFATTKRWKLAHLRETTFLSNHVIYYIHRDLVNLKMPS